MTDYGATDTSTTTIGANQFPVSAAWVPGDALRPVGGTPANTDGGGKLYTAVLMFPSATLGSLSAWTSATALNTTQTIFSGGFAESVLVQLTQTSTLTAGAITFEVSYDGSTWQALPTDCVIDPTSSSFTTISLPYTLQASANKQFLLRMRGAQGLHIKLSTAITGTGAVTPNYALLPASPMRTVYLADGGNVTQGNTTDAAVVGDTSGTLSAKLRGLTKILTDIWDSTNHLFHFNIKQVGGTTVDTNSGNKSAGTLRVVLATDQPSLANALTTNAAQSGTWTVQPGNTPNSTAWLMQMVAGTTGGSTPFHALSTASNNATSLKGSAGTLYGYSLSNNNATARYVKFYNKASAPAPATDTPVWVEMVPGNSIVVGAFPEGMAFGTGIAFAAVLNMSDTDNTSITAGDLSMDMRYK